MKRNLVIVIALVALLGWMKVYAEPIRVGLLLSLQADLEKRDKNMDRFADFYTGALMSVYETRNSLHQVEIYTYDIGKTAEEMQQVLDSNQLDSLDIIIGPTYPAQVSVMAEWTNLHEVLVILPFASDIPEIETNPFLLQFNPTAQMEAQALVDHITQKGEPVRFIFVAADESNIPSSVYEIHQCVMNSDIEYVYTTAEQIMNDSLVHFLDGTKENILLLNTERFVNVRNVLPYLNRAAEGKSLTLCSRYSWQGEAITLPQIYPSVFASNVQIDSTAYCERYNQYVSRKRVNSHPLYDVLGYDIMTYALKTVQLIKDNLDEDVLPEDIIQRPFVGMQSNMSFVRVDEIGGYVNHHILVERTE